MSEAAEEGLFNDVENIDLVVRFVVDQMIFPVAGPFNAETRNSIFNQNIEAPAKPVPFKLPLSDVRAGLLSGEAWQPSTNRTVRLPLPISHAVRSETPLHPHFPGGSVQEHPALFFAKRCGVC